MDENYGAVFLSTGTLAGAIIIPTRGLRSVGRRPV